MTRHMIVGAGPVGSATALLLSQAGHNVRIISRSGSGPDASGVERMAADAADAGALAPVIAGADVIYDCAGPPYDKWATDWPPIAAALIDAAAANDAVLVTMSNLYGYGPVDHPMVETDPIAATGTKGRVRATMWADALAAHEAGHIRTTEARASDYFGPGLTSSSPLGRVIPRLLSGKTIRVMGDPDALHSWTYVPDVARTLVVLGTDPRAWGRPWHVPTNPPLSQREAIDRLAQLAGVAAPKVRTMPHLAMRAAGLVVPTIRELDEVAYQFDRSFIIDSSSFTATFGVIPTPMDEALAATLTWWTPTAAKAA